MGNRIDTIVRENDSYAALNNAIYALCSLLTKEIPNINVELDSSSILQMYVKAEKEKSLATLYPELIREWDDEKNGDITPDMLSPQSNKKIWWKCSRGHEYQSTVSNRVYGSGCPYCAGKKILIGYNDLATLFPKPAEEWDYEKNGNLTPNRVTSGSNKKVWWKCSKGHVWQAAISIRAKQGHNCPYCSHQRVIYGETDLATVNPKLAEEWDYEKNGELAPNQVMPGSDRKVWWKCSKGHIWQAAISSRNNGSGCPYCSGRKHLE